LTPYLEDIFQWQSRSIESFVFAPGKRFQLVVNV